MIKRIYLFIVVVGFTANLFAQNNPVQLSLINTIQLVPENQSVSAFRLALYGKNTRTQYLDVGIVTQNTDGMSMGLQLSFAGIQDDFTGWQAGTLVNYSYGDVKGLMTGAFNYSAHFVGVQFGVVNFTETANGIQIGLVNFIKKGGFLPVFPIFNFSLK